MRSGGFGLGKKTRSEEPKRLPPSNADLTQLLNSSQKSPDKIFSLSWAAKGTANSQFTLTVMNCGAQRDRRGWSSSAIDNSSVGEAEWKLSQETNAISTVIFSMRSSDSYLIHTLIEETQVTGGAPGAVAAMPASVAPEPSTASDMPFESQASMSAPGVSSPAAQEGSLRQTSVRALLERFNVSKTTGRLICDIGTVQSEVFLTSGEPVHAKSCHSISQGRDMVGDAALIDLLTWKDGTYKFQEGWPAASKSITSPLHMFLSGSVTVPDPAIAAAANNAVSSPSPPSTDGAGAGDYSASAPSSYSAASAAPHAPHAQPAPPSMPRPAAAAPAGPADDFSRVDDLIGATYANLVESTGLLKYGMFLMLVRSEFARFEKGRSPFCFASIGLELPNGNQLTDAAITRINERFEKVCQPLDALSYAGPGRFYALFPQVEGTSASVAIKQFINNVMAIPLDAGLHGSAVKMTVGLAEIPRDGTDFRQVFQKASGLRGQATPDKKIVSSSF